MEIPRESIFRNAIRVFCKMLFGLLGIMAAFVIFSMGYSLLSPSPLIEQKTTLTILPDADGNRELLSFNTPAILQIQISGVIGDPTKIDTDLVQNILIDSRTGLLANNRVKGILLYFNTPGGTVVDSDNIYELLKQYKQKYNVPIFGFVDGLCASGGMYIASAADQMFAGPSSLIGSVGVVLGPFFNFYDLMGKVGIGAYTFTEGLDKDMMNPTRPWTEGDKASLKPAMAFMYQRFLDIVTGARSRLDKTKLVQEYGAQVYDCVTAEKYGYIDHAMSSRNEALKALLIDAKIDPKEHYQVVSLSPKHSLIASLVSEKSPLFSGKIEHALPGALPEEVRNQPCYLYRYE